MPAEERRPAFLEKERALRVLRNSKLTVYDEYKRMLRDIQHYIEDAKRAASGGTKRRENDMRPFLYDTGDTYEKPFYSVLTKMLLEISSMKNSQKQAEDLQRVYQWYVTNKRQLCKTDKRFASSEITSNSLKYRPSSSIDPGVKSGILRHDNMTKSAPKRNRPYTSYMSLERGRLTSPEIEVSAEAAINDSVLEVKSIEGISAPEIPDNLNDFKDESTMDARKTPKRPDTAPPFVMLDNNPVKKNNTKYAGSVVNIASGDNGEMQSPVSKVSIHYNSSGDAGQATRIYQIEHQNSRNSNTFRDSVRSKSAGSFHKSIRLEADLSEVDWRSEIDEDRILVDADLIVQNAEMSESQRSIEKAVENDTLDVQMPSSGSSKDSVKQQRSETLSSAERDSVAVEVPNEERPRIESIAFKTAHQEKAKQTFEYIPSYSKFQQLKERKQAGTKEENERNLAQGAIQSPRTSRHHVAKKQADLHMGLNKNGLSAATILQLVTPVGQQMLEQKSPIQISQEFLKDVKHSPTSSPLNSPHDRLSPRPYMRSTAGGNADHNGQMLKKAQIMFPEESPRQYKVHFPKERNTKTEKHYKVSGPVEPDSLRYQPPSEKRPTVNINAYTHDGFGSRTYLKRLTRPQYSSRSSNLKSRTQTQSPHAVFKNDPLVMNSRALASSMIIRHLGRCDRRSSDRMSGQSNVIPMWISSPESENRLPDDKEYVKLTKPYEKESTPNTDISEDKRPKYHVKQIDVDLLDSSQPLYIVGDERGRNGDWESGRFVEMQSAQRSSAENLEANYRETYQLNVLSQYNGGYFPLKAEGHAVSVGEKSQSNTRRAPSSPSPTPRSQSSSRPSSRPSSHRIDRTNGQNISPIPGANRPLSSCSRASNRLGSGHSSRYGSAHSTRRPRSGAKSRTDEHVEEVFGVNKFSHYCFDDNPSLEDDYQLQRKTNAAVDIQRIFRGYMVRKYARELKIAEKERQKRAAIKIQSATRGFLARKRVMEDKLNQRPPQVDVVEWEKTYKEERKKRDNERMVKAQVRSKKMVKLQVQQDDRMRKVSASKTIYDIFHDKGPTKAQMKAAAITIQRFVRGWLVRRFYQKAKQKAMKRTLDFNGFLKSYKDHLERIMERHGVKDPKAVLAFDELLDYIEKRNKYEIEYDRIAKGKPKQHTGVFTYEDIKKFFEACGQHPSRKEVEDAIAVAVQDVVEMKEHSYTKAQIVEIAFQIYVPKGTNLVDTRKSTWLNPIIDGDEAAKMKLSKKINAETNLEKVFDLLSASKRGQVEMEQRAITPDLLPIDAKLNGFEKLKEKPLTKSVQQKKKK